MSFFCIHFVYVCFNHELRTFLQLFLSRWIELLTRNFDIVVIFRVIKFSFISERKSCGHFTSTFTKIFRSKCLFLFGYHFHSIGYSDILDLSTSSGFIQYEWLYIFGWFPGIIDIIYVTVLLFLKTEFLHMIIGNRGLYCYSK